MFNNHTRYYQFLAGLLKKMQSKLIKKHDVDLQDSFTMKFKRLYNNAQKRASKLKYKYDLNKVISKETFQKLN